jgi:hypothetical protein
MLERESIPALPPVTQKTSQWYVFGIEPWTSTLSQVNARPEEIVR